MELTTATELIDEAYRDADSVSGASALSAMERIFCDVFVVNGGDGEEAALAAGYAASSAKVSACRLLCRERVANRIEFLCRRFMHSRLVVAIHTITKAAGDEQALWKDRIKAATCILDRAGMDAPKGGLQVNVGVQVNGQQAQAIIASVHEARAARLSDIPPAMPDTLQSDLRDIEQLAIGPPAMPPGGDQALGPIVESRSVPVSETARPAKLHVSCECEDCRAKENLTDDEPDVAASFRNAFRDGHAD